ncbi:MAG: RIP metalloprotease RseP [Flavobacteriaceae bacterium]|jgi:regulator of sigma E protease|nr:RIP metalloprotease RseP [Flavobacteriaceae bacterium]
MKEILIQVAQLILCLSILVTLHELGHYWAAKYFKTRVEKFMLFFDPGFAIFKKKIGETVYGIGWLPLGGYVKIAGMIDESMDKEQLKQPPKPWEFRSKPAWQRLIIMLGGVFVNFILAWLIYTVMLVVNGDNYISIDKMQENGLEFSEAMKHAGFQDGDKILTVDGKHQPRADWMVVDILLAEQVIVERDGKEVAININDGGVKAILNGAKGQGLYMPSPKEIIVDSLIPNGNALAAGVKISDKIIGVNNSSVENFGELKRVLDVHKGDSIVLDILRDNQKLEVLVLVSDSASLGFARKGLDQEFFQGLQVTNEYGVLAAIPAGLSKTFTNLAYQIKQFKLLIRPKTEAYKQISGPLRLFKVFDPGWDWTRFWNFTAMFSIWLAFLNLLPIPALDGGHALFTIIEMITGRKMSEKTMEIAQITGFVILMSLMALVFGNDIIHLIKGT